LKLKILIVEDQFIEAYSLERILLKAGYATCSIARSVPIALKILDKEQPDLVLLDIQLQGSLTGIDLAKTLRKNKIPFVYLSANSNKKILEEAKSTMPQGFLVKPFREKDVLVMIEVAWYLHEHRIETPQPAPQNITHNTFKNFLGNSAKIKAVLSQVKVVSDSDVSVLILGESGTGKELIAKDIHQNSKRKNKPFVVVNCSALPESLIESELFGHEKGAFTGAHNKRTGKFEQADGGTIFLDEIGELPLEMQVKFLRVLQEREIEPIAGQVKKIDVRVLAATNRNLSEEIAVGRFRLDLFYRLNVFPIELPPLRERKNDVVLLAQHFLEKYSKESNKTIDGFSPNAAEQLQQYEWPGNVRELENLIFRSVLLSETEQIENIELPLTLAKTSQVKVKTILENERDHILSVLEQCNWKVFGNGGAAEVLDMHISTLNSRMKKLGISKPKSSNS